ncbi:MAG: DpnD/PcfM family protein [Bacteroidota bacterium]
MKTYKIEIQEFLARIVEVKSENIYEAISKINEQYKRAEIVLDYNDFVEVDFIDINSQSKSDEKNKLMKEIIEHLYSDEKRHFEELDKPDNHIFSKLERLKTLLD